MDYISVRGLTVIMLCPQEIQLNIQHKDQESMQKKKRKKKEKKTENDKN